MSDVTIHCGSIAELRVRIRKDMQSRQKRIKQAAVRAAEHGRRYIITHTLPIAFRQLEKSLKVVQKGDSVSIVADAPHAAAVEVGSRPHTPPLEPLIAWVKLRATQGIGGARARAPKRHRGTTTKEHSRAIAATMKSLEQNGANAIDDPVKIARAIQRAIARAGTRPHWYMAQALPEVERVLISEIAIAVKEVASGTGSDQGVRVSVSDRFHGD